MALFARKSYHGTRSTSRAVPIAVLAALFVVAFVAVGFASSSCEAQKARQFGDLAQYTGAVVVKFDDGVNEAQARSALQTTGFALKRTVTGDAGTLYFLDVPAGQQLPALCELSEEQRVFYATLERRASG